MSDKHTLPGDSGMSGIDYGKGVTGETHITVTAPSDGGVGFAKARGGHTERRSGSFANDGVPSVQRGDELLEALMPGENVNVHFWSPGPTVRGGFSTPAGTSTGLTWDGSSIWNADWSSGYIYELDRDGSVVGGFDSPAAATSGAQDIAWDGSSFWHSISNSDYIYEFDRDGNIKGGFSPPSNGTVKGVAFDGESLWMSDSHVNYVYEVDRSGNVLSGFTPPGPNTNRLTWDGERLWMGNNYLYRVTRGGTTVGGFDDGFGSSEAVKWTGGEFLVGHNTADYIYKLSGNYDYTAGVMS